jgi:hypothetical protein
VPLGEIAGQHVLGTDDRAQAAQEVVAHRVIAVLVPVLIPVLIPLVAGLVMRMVVPP